MNAAEAFRHTHTLSLTLYPCFPHFLFVFLPFSQTNTHACKTNTQARERERKRRRDRARRRRRTGKGRPCAVLPLHSFLLGWSFPSGGERDCKLSKRTVRKQEAPSSSRESEMKSIWGPRPLGRPRGAPLLERQFVRRYPSYEQGGSYWRKILPAIWSSSSTTKVRAGRH